MALIKCPECGGNVSDQAPKCPHCGFDMESRVICVSCGHMLSSNDAKCPQCGTLTPWSNLFVTCPECGEHIRRGLDTCPKCGILLRFTDFCEECGHALDKSKPTCVNCGRPAPWARTCPECSNSVMPTENYCSKCGYDMEIHFGKVGTLSDNSSNSISNGTPPTNASYEDGYLYEERTSSKKKWFILAAIIVIAAIGALFGTKAYNDHQVKIAMERHVADSIQSENNRLAAIESSRLAEQQRIERERQERERMLAATHGTYIFRDCQRDKKYRTHYTYGDVGSNYDRNNMHEYPDGSITWDTEVKIDSDGKVHLRDINMVETDRNGNVIDRQDVYSDRGIIGEVVLISDGVFKINGKSQNLLFGAKPRPGAYSRGGEVGINQCVFDNNSNILYENESDYTNRNGYDEVIAFPYTHDYY